MAMAALEQNAISRAMNAAAKIIREVYPVAHELNVLYDSQGGLKTTISQEDLDSVPLSGLTKQQLDDGLYAITATLKGAIEGAYTALAELAARA